MSPASTKNPAEGGSAAPSEATRLSARARALDRLLRLLVKRRLQRLMEGGVQRVNVAGAQRSRRRLERWARFGGRLPAQVHVAQTRLGHLVAEELYPLHPGPSVVLYVHGGGFILGSPLTHRTLTRHLAAQGNTRVFVPEYRLAPEHAYPAALEDVVAAYRELCQSTPPQHILIAGDSAGGNLAFAAVHRLRERGMPLPGGVIGISPWTDLTCSGESMVRNAAAEAMLAPAAVQPGALAYAGGAPLDLPTVSPLFGTFEGFPPVLLHVSDSEILLDDSLRLAEKLRAADVRVELRVWHGLPHVFHAFADFVPEARAALREIGMFVRRVTAGSAER